jgi:predicted nucleic acid-binding protein
MADSSWGDRVLLDNSAWARVGLGKLPALTVARWEAAVRRDEIVVCPPFALEALYSATSAAHYAQLQAELGGFRQAPADEETWRLAAMTQQRLAENPAVSHRVKPIDLLIAAVAEQQALAVLHYDKDFDLIRRHTPFGFRSIWIAPRGSVD